MKQVSERSIRNYRVGGLVLLITLFFMTGLSYSQVAINTDNSAPDESAMLDVKATGLGFLVPRMTSANKPGSPATGLLIYQTDSNPGYYYYDGAAWQKVGRLSDDYWAANGGDIYYNLGGVAIKGTDSDDHGLNVSNYIAGKAAVYGADRFSTSIYAEGLLGVLQPSSLGIPVDVFNIGVLGIKPNMGSNGAAVYGWNLDDNLNNYGGVFVAEGTTTGSNYAIYADAVNASVNNWAGHFKGRVRVLGSANGDVAGDKFSPVFTAEVGISGVAYDVQAIYANSTPLAGYGVGIYSVGGYMGIETTTNNTTYSGTAYALYASAYGTGGTRIGVYGTASGGSTNWAGYFEGSAYVGADLRIGTQSAATGYRLSVNGKIACEEVLVQDNGTWPDYVFDKEYLLISLEELEENIKEEKHLPGFPSAKAVETDGFKIGEMQKLMLKKVEELTLYTIEQGKQIRELQNEVEALKAENNHLKQ